MADREKKKIISRKHLARVEREQIQKRYLTIITAVIVALVILVIGAGFILEGIVKPRQPIATVDETTITTKQFQSFVRYQRYRLVTEYLNTYQFIQNMDDPNSFAYFESYLRQIQNELQPEIVGLNSTNMMIENVMIREEANRLGIEVSREEVEAFIAETMFQYYPDGTPTPAPTSPILPIPTLSTLQMTLTAPTVVAVMTDTTTIESEAVTAEDIGEVETAPTEVLPTPTIYTESTYKQNYKDFISYIRNFASVSESDIYEIYENFILRERVAEAVITDISSEEEKLWARHILFQDSETGEVEALAFLDQIEAGEDFVSVAEELAAVIPEADPGATEPLLPTVIYEDLNWFGEGAMVEPFDQAAKLLAIGEISQPVLTNFGWHVIQLLGRDTQPVSQADIDQLREQAFQEWLAALRLEHEINITQDWINAVPLEPDIPETIKLQDPITAE